MTSLVVVSAVGSIQFAPNIPDNCTSRESGPATTYPVRLMRSHKTVVVLSPLANGKPEASAVAPTSAMDSRTMRMWIANGLADAEVVAARSIVAMRMPMRAKIVHAVSFATQYLELGLIGCLSHRRSH